MLNTEGFVYLIRLDRPLGRCHYYCGFANNVEGRLYYHRQGKGSKFLAECNRQGITYSLVADWPGDRNLERCMKNTRNLKRFDPTRSGYISPLEYHFDCNIPKHHPTRLISDTQGVKSAHVGCLYTNRKLSLYGPEIAKRDKIENFVRDFYDKHGDAMSKLALDEVYIRPDWDTPTGIPHLDYLRGLEKDYWRLR